MKLLNDVTRCHDATCPFRLECARFMQRGVSHGGGPVVSVATMFTGFTQELGDGTGYVQCVHFIQNNEERKGS